MGMKMLAGMALSAIFTANVGAIVITDDFSGPSLNTSLWTVVENANSYSEGGGAFQSGGLYTINASKVGAASGIRASLGNVTATDNVRVDAIVRTDQHNNGRWSMKTAIYFDNENWIGLKLGYSNGEDGLDRQGMKTGANYWDLDLNGDDGWATQWSYIILSVELTATEVRFYASPQGQSFMNNTNIDGNVSLLPLLTMARPASYVGEAYAFIGKGYGTSNAASPFLNTNNSPTDSASASYIDYARLTLVPEPASLGMLAVGALSLMGRRRSIR